MRKQYWQARCAAMLAVGLLTGSALAQSPEITSFSENGQLTWTNSDTNLFYRIEWAPSLTAPDTWQSNYCALADIRSSASVVTSSVPMFYRVCGSSNRVVFPSPVPKTGQTNSYQTGDGGYYKNGLAWPTPRFTVQANTNCVLDNLTGLIWARNANIAGTKTWSAAITYCENLTYGGTNDWRLPNFDELHSLIDAERYSPALPVGHPFANVQTVPAVYYWSSTTYQVTTSSAWYINLFDGLVRPDSKSLVQAVWPVRGGQ